MNSIKPIIEESERTLREAIAHFKLQIKPEEICVLVQTRGTKKRALGWFAPDRWDGAKLAESRPTILHEITLCAEVLRDHHMGETLLHELAHAENHKLGIKDTGKDGRVHNKAFKSMAERLGLIVADRDKSIGFAFTTLGSEAEKFLSKINFNRSIFEMFRLEGSPKEGKGSRMIKLTCQCGFVARASQKCIDMGVPVHCGEEMAVEEKEEDL